MTILNVSTECMAAVARERMQENEARATAASIWRAPCLAASRRLRLALGLLWWRPRPTPAAPACCPEAG